MCIQPLPPTWWRSDMKYIPLIRKKNAPVSFATARAIRVLPVPGGPYNKIPRGGWKQIDARLTLLFLSWKLFAKHNSQATSKFLDRGIISLVTLPNSSGQQVTYFDSNSLEELWMSERQFNHLFDLGQLFTATTNVIIAHLVQRLFLLLQSQGHSCKELEISCKRFIIAAIWIVGFRNEMMTIVDLPLVSLVLLHSV